MLLIIPFVSFAQSASDSYNKGIALMNKAAYTEAIACFRASMAINKSAANVKKCRTQINKCQRLQKRSAASVKPVVEMARLDVNKTLMTFPADREQTIAAKVESAPANVDWTAVLSANASWCRLTKSMDGSELHVTCSPSNSTIQRTASVNIIFGELTHTINIVQKGKAVHLDTDSKFVSFTKRKGGSKVIIVNCESDTLYAANKNWIIEERPSWCTLEENQYTLKVTVNKLTKKDADYKTGRTGDIVLRSQNKKCTIRVDQK